MNEKKCRLIVKERSQLCCEICGLPGVQMHHRKNRSQGGAWTPTNIVHLCVSCHGHITHFPTTAATYGWTVKSYEDPTTVRVFLGEGWWYLNDDGTKEEAA